MPYFKLIYLNLMCCSLIFTDYRFEKVIEKSRSLLYSKLILIYFIVLIFSFTIKILSLPNYFLFTNDTDIKCILFFDGPLKSVLTAHLKLCFLNLLTRSICLFQIIQKIIFLIITDFKLKVLCFVDEFYVSFTKFIQLNLEKFYFALKNIFSQLMDLKNTMSLIS